MRKAFYPRALYAIALIALGVFVAVVSGWLFAWLGSGFGGTSIGRSTGSTVVLADVINPGEGILSLDPDKVLARFDQDAPDSFNAEVLGEWGDWHSLSDDGVIAGCVLSGTKFLRLAKLSPCWRKRGGGLFRAGKELFRLLLKEKESIAG